MNVLRRRSLLALPLLAAACGHEDDMRFGYGLGVPGRRSATPAELAPGYDASAPAGAINLVAIGDSITTGLGDNTAKGGFVHRIVGSLVAEFGAGHLFRFRGTIQVRGYVGSHWTEGFGGIEYKIPAQWGSLAAGASINNVDQAILNKPMTSARIGSGRPMLGIDGYHQDNLHMVLWCVGANNVTNYGETPEAIAAMVLASTVRLRERLNQKSPGCIIAFMPDFHDLGGSSPASATLNHNRVLAVNALLPGVVSDFNALYPTQPLLSGFSWYDTLGLWSETQYQDLIHPNEVGYNLLGAGMYTFLQPTFQALAA